MGQDDGVINRFNTGDVAEVVIRAGEDGDSDGAIALVGRCFSAIPDVCLICPVWMRTCPG